MSRGGSGDSGFAQKSVDELVAEYEKMVSTGKVLAPFAAENLEHWLGNTGTKRIVMPAPFQNDSKVNDHLKNVQRNIFLSTTDKTKGLFPRIKRSPGAATYAMTWEDSTYAKALSELFFALGGFTLRSKVSVQVTPMPAGSNNYQVKFLSWEAQAFDNYNWDHGKSVHIPGWGKIDDKEALRVERAGRAKSFLIESHWWRVTNPQINGPTTIKV